MLIGECYAKNRSRVSPLRKMSTGRVQELGLVDPELV